MIMGSVGGPGVMKAYATDKQGNRTMFQGTNMADIESQIKNWKPGGSGVGNASQVMGAGGSMGLNFGSNQSGNMGFQNASMQQSQQIQAMRNQGAFGGTANQQGRPQTAFNTAPQGQTNVMYPMGGGPAGAGQAAPMMGGGGGVPGIMGGGGIQGLLGQQQAENNRAEQINTQRWNEGKAGMQGVLAQNQSNPIAQGTRGLVQEFLNNPESLNDRTANAIRNRQSNQIRSQTDNQFQNAAGMLGAGGQMDQGSLAALRRGFDRQGQAAIQNANMDLDVTRANQRSGDMARAIGLGQSQTGQDTGLALDVNKTLLQETPQQMPNDLSGWVAALGQQGGMGGGMMGGGFNNVGTVGGFGGGAAMGGGGGYAGGQDMSLGSWNMPIGFTRPKGPSTYAGFDMFDTRPGDAYANQQYAANKAAENARNTASWNAFAAAKPTAYGNAAPSAPMGPLGGGNQAQMEALAMQLFGARKPARENDSFNMYQ